MRISRRLRQLLQVLKSCPVETVAENKRNYLQRYSTLEELLFYSKIARQGMDPNEAYACRIAKKLLGDENKRAVLVVGCGAGREAFHLEKMDFQVTGLDENKDMLEAAKVASKDLGSSNRWVLGNIEQIKPNSFDLVFISSVISSHIPGFENRVDFFREVSKRLKKNGIIAYYPNIDPFSIFDYQWVGSKLMHLRWHKKRKWERGDGVKSFLGQHNTDENLLYFYAYQSSDDFISHLEAAGLSGVQTSSGYFLIQRKDEASTLKTIVFPNPSPGSELPY